MIEELKRLHADWCAAQRLYGKPDPVEELDGTTCRLPAFVQGLVGWQGGTFTKGFLQGYKGLSAVSVVLDDGRRATAANLEAAFSLWAAQAGFA